METNCSSFEATTSGGKKSLLAPTRNSDFLDGGEGMECLDDVAHVGTAAGEDDAALGGLFRLNLLDDNKFTKAAGVTTDNIVAVGLTYQF